MLDNIVERIDIAYLTDHKEVVPTLARWFYEEWGYLHPARTLADVERLVEERANRNEIPLTLIAFAGQELIGTVCLKIHDMDTRLDLKPWLANLYVAASRRGQGIGIKLVSAIEKKARELGVEKLYLFTPESESFYSPLGWQFKERTEFHDSPVTIMQKEFAL